MYRVEAPISGHLREVEKVSTTAAGRLREYVNTVFVCRLEVKQGFVKVAVSRAVSLRECPLRKLQLYFNLSRIFRTFDEESKRGLIENC